MSTCSSSSPSSSSPSSLDSTEDFEEGSWDDLCEELHAERAWAVVSASAAPKIPAATSDTLDLEVSMDSPCADGIQDLHDDRAPCTREVITARFRHRCACPKSIPVARLTRPCRSRIGR